MLKIDQISSQQVLVMINIFSVLIRNSSEILINFSQNDTKINFILSLSEFSSIMRFILMVLISVILIYGLWKVFITKRPTIIFQLMVTLLCPIHIWLSIVGLSHFSGQKKGLFYESNSWYITNITIASLILITFPIIINSRFNFFQLRANNHISGGYQCLLGVDFVVQAVGGVVVSEGVFGNGNINGVDNNTVMTVIVLVLGIIKLTRSVWYILTVNYADMMVEYCALLGQISSWMGFISICMSVFYHINCTTLTWITSITIIYLTISKHQLLTSIVQVKYLKILSTTKQSLMQQISQNNRLNLIAQQQLLSMLVVVVNVFRNEQQRGCSSDQQGLIDVGKNSNVNKGVNNYSNSYCCSQQQWLRIRCSPALVNQTLEVLGIFTYLQAQVQSQENKHQQQINYGQANIGLTQNTINIDEFNTIKSRIKHIDNLFFLGNNVNQIVVDKHGNNNNSDKKNNSKYNINNNINKNNHTTNNDQDKRTIRKWQTLWQLTSNIKQIHLNNNSNNNNNQYSDIRNFIIYTFPSFNNNCTNRLMYLYYLDNIRQQQQQHQQQSRPFFMKIKEQLAYNYLTQRVFAEHQIKMKSDLYKKGGNNNRERSGQYQNNDGVSLNDCFVSTIIIDQNNENNNNRKSKSKSPSFKQSFTSCRQLETSTFDHYYKFTQTQNHLQQQFINLFNLTMKITQLTSTLNKSNNNSNNNNKSFVLQLLLKKNTLQQGINQKLQTIQSLNLKKATIYKFVKQYFINNTPHIALNNLKQRNLQSLMQQQQQKQQQQQSNKARTKEQQHNLLLKKDQQYNFDNYSDSDNYKKMTVLVSGIQNYGQILHYCTNFNQTMQISKAINISNTNHHSAQNQQHLTINDLMLPTWVKRHNIAYEQCRKYAIPQHNSKPFYIISLATRRVYEITFNMHYILRDMHDLVYCLDISQRAVEKLFVYNKKSGLLMFESFTNRLERQQARRRKVKQLKKKRVSVIMGRMELSESDLSKHIKSEESYFGEQCTIYKRYRSSTRQMVMGNNMSSQQTDSINISSVNNKNNNNKKDINNNKKDIKNKKKDINNFNDNTTIFENNNNNNNYYNNNNSNSNNNEYQQQQQQMSTKKQSPSSSFSLQKNRQKKTHHHYNPQQMFSLRVNTYKNNNNNKIGCQQQQQQSINGNKNNKKIGQYQQQQQSQSQQSLNYTRRQHHQTHHQSTTTNLLKQEITLKQYTTTTLFHQNKLKLFTFIHWQIPPIIFVISFIIRYYSIQENKSNMNVYETKLILENQFMVVDTQVVSQLMYLDMAGLGMGGMGGVGMGGRGSNTNYSYSSNISNVSSNISSSNISSSSNKQQIVKHVIFEDIKRNVNTISSRQQSLLNKIVNNQQLAEILFTNNKNNKNNNSNNQQTLTNNQQTLTNKNSFFYTTLQFQVMLQEYLYIMGYQGLIKSNSIDDDIVVGNKDRQQQYQHNSNNFRQKRFFNKFRHRFQQYVNLQGDNNDNNNNINNNNALFTDIKIHQQQTFKFSKTFLTYFMIAVAVVAFSTAFLFVIVYVDLQYSIQKLVLGALNVPNVYVKRIKGRLGQGRDILQSARQQLPNKIIYKYEQYHHYRKGLSNSGRQQQQQQQQLYQSQQQSSSKVIEKMIAQKKTSLNNKTMKSINTMQAYNNDNNITKGNQNLQQQPRQLVIPKIGNYNKPHIHQYYNKPYSTRYQVTKHYILPIITFILIVTICEYLLISFISSVIKEIQLIDTFSTSVQELAEVAALSNQIGIEMTIVLFYQLSGRNDYAMSYEGFREKLGRYKEMDRLGMLRVVSPTEGYYIGHAFESVCGVLQQYQEYQEYQVRQQKQQSFTPSTTIPTQCTNTNKNTLSYYELITSNLKHYKTIESHIFLLKQQLSKQPPSLTNNNNPTYQSTNNLTNKLSNNLTPHLHTIHSQQSLINSFTTYIINKSQQNYQLMTVDPTQYLDLLIIQMVVIIVLFNYFTLYMLLYKMRSLYKMVFCSCTVQEMREIQGFRYFVNQSKHHKMTYVSGEFVDDN